MTNGNGLGEYNQREQDERSGDIDHHVMRTGLNVEDPCQDKQCGEGRKREKGESPVLRLSVKDGGAFRKETPEDQADDDEAAGDMQPESRYFGNP